MALRPDSETEAQEPYAMARVILLTLALIGVVALASYSIAVNAGPVPADYDLPSLLLTSAILSLATLTGLVALAAFWGWRELRTWVGGKIDERISEVNREHLGLMKFVTGLFYGRMCRVDTEDVIRVEHPDLLQHAISYTREALELFENPENRRKARNNLAFYYALDGHPAHGPTAKDLAEAVRADFSRTGSVLCLTTYGRVVGIFHKYFDRPAETLEEAILVLDELQERQDVPEMEKTNARRHVKLCRRALESYEEGV